MNPAYPAFTIAMLLAAGLCLRDALGDRADVALFGAALGYGLLLEKATVVAFDAYSYPASEYLVAPLSIPIAIALGWAAVIYAGVATARSLGTPRRSLPAFVALYALHVDLAMDAVAIRVPYWQWHDPGPWFGVPYGNFFGWFWVALLLPAWFFALDRRIARPAVRAGLAVVLSIGSLLPILEAWTRVTAAVPATEVPILLGCGLTAVAVVGARPPTFDRAPPLEPAAATLVFHLFFLGIVLGRGYYRTTPTLVALSLGMLGVGVAVHLAPRVAGRR